MCPYPARARIACAAYSARARAAAAAGRTSQVPLGAWNFGSIRKLAGQLGQERVGRPLGPQRGDPHVARIDGRLRRMGVDQRADRLEQGRPVPSGKVDPADRPLEEDVAGEDRVLGTDRVGDMTGAVTGGEDDV